MTCFILLLSLFGLWMLSGLVGLIAGELLSRCSFGNPMTSSAFRNAVKIAIAFFAAWFLSLCL